MNQKGGRGWGRGWGETEREERKKGERCVRGHYNVGCQQDCLVFVCACGVCVCVCVSEREREEKGGEI